MSRTTDRVWHAQEYTGASNPTSDVSLYMTRIPPSFGTVSFLRASWVATEWRHRRKALSSILSDIGGIQAVRLADVIGNDGV